jgi:hypothetical protein
MKAAKWARSRGYYVSGTYDFSGKDDNKAPKLMAPPRGESLVLPDLQCFKVTSPDPATWMEVKWKARAVLYRKGGYRVTGINKRHWQHYQKVQHLTSAKVFVMFIHDAESEIRADTLDDLRAYVSHEYDGDKMGRGGMVFWPYDDIPCWGDLGMLNDC